MYFATLKSKNRQRGMALVLAIGFLAVLSILGAVVMQVSMRDLQGTTETLPNQNALYAADRTVEYAMNRDIIVNLAVNEKVIFGVEDPANPGTTKTSPRHNAENASGASLGVTHYDVINASNVINGQSTATIVSGSVEDVGPRALPPHLAALHGSEFGANLYHVNVKTRSATLNKTTHVDAAIVRLFKMDDDQIFRTSGGG